VCLAEIRRHLTPSTLPSLKNQRLSEILVELSSVLDCTDLVALGVDEAALFDDYNYSTGQALAAAALARGCESLLIPSATRLPDPNLIIFTTQLQLTSSYHVTSVVLKRSVCNWACDCGWAVDVVERPIRMVAWQRTATAVAGRPCKVSCLILH